MSSRLARRGFLQAGLTGGIAAGLGDFGFLSALRPISADDARLPTDVVQLRPEIAPIVRLIEETPRERLMEVIAERVRQGLSYQELLAGLLLAGVKNVEPRPQVGFKFHAVLVVNSAHLASLASPDEHRWLPIFWALDHYKSAEARDVEERGDWVLPAVRESGVPAPHEALPMFRSAMDNWDEGQADVAVAQLARTAGANEVYEAFFRYGARDFRSIGHKAIYVANSWRTLQCIGWQHAEPILRSLAYALLMHEGSNPAERDDDTDRPFRENEERLAQIRSDWRSGVVDSSATEQMLQVLRQGSNTDACELVVELLNRGVAAQSIWDALHVAGGEYLMQQTGIVALHAVTTANALRYAYETTANDETRRLMLLQCAAFLPMFRASMESRGELAKVSIESLNEAEAPATEPTLDEIFSQLGSDRLAACRQTRHWLMQRTNPQELIAAARTLVFLKGNDAHDYKFSSAVLEDCGQISPGWREIYLASNVINLHASTERDNPLVERIRQAFA
jgi:hypothetical protein